MSENVNYIKPWSQIQKEYETENKDYSELQLEAANKNDVPAIRGIQKHFNTSTETITSKTMNEIYEREGKPNIQNRGDEDFEDFTHHPWLPTCGITMSDIANCQILPCNHRISKHALLMQVDSGHLYCPMCGNTSKNWKEVRCSSVKRTEDNMTDMIEKATKGFQKGSKLKELFTKIYNFIICKDILGILSYIWNAHFLTERHHS